MPTHHRLRGLARFALLAGAALALGACARTVVENRLETTYEPGDMTAELDFWHNLPGRSAVTNDEGLHGVLLFAKGEDTTGSYEARVERLKEMGWLPSGFDEPPDLAMQRGVLAKALAHMLDIEGGVMYSITNKHPRYATRELVYLGLLGHGTEQQVISGVDYVGAFSKAQDYMLLRDLGELRARPDAVRRVPVREDVRTPFRDADTGADEAHDPGDAPERIPDEAR
ncbi:MAG: hypothetical protein EA379_07530 [Phycisphaerales bacterium]|nr:MAG: hypothetical protein EA379_07530 [Phycisphaerales bacterium]